MMILMNYPNDEIFLVLNFWVLALNIDCFGHFERVFERRACVLRYCLYVHSGYIPIEVEHSAR